ncbi:ATP-binding protein [uncultured Desulfuromusa sp.]|uniref:ATP-binding protein n=1 Tax=uncultured Desulfuromusa sp. TaxID=219183 RepID=UPI002AA71D42|nr:ATP-binding protein [uncultured Desulfuromusa sp.]
MNEPIKTPFKPRARLLQLLGDQLIKDPRIGVFELVKNAYDADSPSADIFFRNIEQLEKASIEVRDSGDGMDLETVQNVWLEPGADYRQVQRENGIRTERFNRLPLGEKGVGRFAAHKLGNKIRLITRKEGHPELVVEIDWDKLTSNSNYLSEANVEIISREPEIFTEKNGSPKGTLIAITELRQPWTRGEVRDLYRSVNAISSPFDTKYGFTVNFTLNPKSDWLDGLLDVKDIQEQAIFYFLFEIENGSFNFRYEFRPLPALEVKGVEKRQIEEKDAILEYFTIGEDEDGKRKKHSNKPDLEKLGLGVGPLIGEIFGYDRDKEIMTLLTIDKKGLSDHLNKQGGVRVYRDGIRVYNYGEPETDWLGLDERRVQIPAKRISNNLIIGEIHLDLEKSPKLVEKTNREGFVENPAYQNFREAVKSAIIRFETERAKDKERIRDAFKVEKEGPLAKLSGPDLAISALREKVKETGQEQALGKYVDKVESTYVEMRDTLLDAAGSGLGLSTVFHEIERGVRDLHRSISKKDASEKIELMAKHLVELLQGASYFVRKSSKEKIKASDIVKHAIFSNSLRFDYHNIKIHNGFEGDPASDFELTGSRRMIMASVVNLIDNSIHWLNVNHGKKDVPESKKIKRIWVGPVHNQEGSAIVIADNGPGFIDNPDEVIRPFFTRKDDGMGMGLYFVQMTMQAHGGRLDFPASERSGAPKAYDAATVALIFKK